jgi:general secretion pathway protein D
VLPTYSPGQAAPSDDRFITRIVRLRNIAADDAANVLGHFKSRDADITPYAATNTLVITDNAGNIRRMMQILAEVDVPSVGEQIWVEPVHYALASELATRINEILGGGTAQAQRPPGQGPPPPDLRLARILADDRSNALVMVATQRMYLRVLELLRRLDVSIEGEGQLRVLRLQHADADEMATTLNNIASGGRQSGGGQGQNPRGQNAIFEGPVRITADKPSNALIDHLVAARLRRPAAGHRRARPLAAAGVHRGRGDGAQHQPLQPLGLNFHGAAAPRRDGPGGLALGGFNALNSILLGAGRAVGPRPRRARPQLAGSQNLIPGVGVSIPAFGVTLNALASTGDANVLSTPHIIATDNSPRTSTSGRTCRCRPTSAAACRRASRARGRQAGINPLAMGFGMGGFAAPRQDVGTKIRITPHINDSNEVRLEIDEEISEVGASSGGSARRGDHQPPHGEDRHRRARPEHRGDRRPHPQRRHQHRDAHPHPRRHPHPRALFRAPRAGTSAATSCSSSRPTSSATRATCGASSSARCASGRSFSIGTSCFRRRTTSRRATTRAPTASSRRSASRSARCAAAPSSRPARARSPPPHSPSESIELPAEMRGQ